MCDDAASSPCASPNAAAVPVAHTWYTNAASSDDWERATVQTSCATTKLLEGQYAYLYLGGYSGINSKGKKHEPVGNAADFGLQFTSHSSDPSEPTNAQGYTFDKQAGDPTKTNINVACGSSVTLTFYVSAYDDKDWLLNLTISGGGQDVTISRTVRESLGWASPCVQCQVKRVTSLAIAPGHDKLGTYFGIDNPFATPAPTAPVPEIRWDDAKESSDGGKSIRPWGEPFTGDQPGNAQSLGLVRVLPQDDTAETVGINEVGTGVVIHGLPHRSARVATRGIK
jgi:hypothetical protein